MELEKRHTQRHIADGSAFAAIGKDYEFIGKIKDISLEGLSIEYFTPHTVELTDTVIAVFTSNNESFVSGLKGKIVYNKCKEPKNGFCTFPGLNIGRCGIALLPVEESQLERLKLFIDKYSESLTSV